MDIPLLLQVLFHPKIRNILSYDLKYKVSCKLSIISSYTKWYSFVVHKAKHGSELILNLPRPIMQENAMTENNTFIILSLKRAAAFNWTTLLIWLRYQWISGLSTICVITDKQWLVRCKCTDFIIIWFTSISLIAKRLMAT